MADGRARGLRGDWIAAIAILAVAAWIAFNPAVFNDGDTSWHLATGQWIVDHRAIPHSDPFSFTWAGKPWTAHEWLADAIVALAYSAAGWAGLAALFAAAVGLTLGLVGRELLRLPLRYAVLALVLVAAALAPFMLARPHVLTWPLLALWLLVLLRARAAHRAPPLGWAVVMLLWANLHGSFLVGLGLAGVFALEALLQEPDRKQVIMRWGAFGLLSLAATFMTPHGIDAFLYPLQVSSMEALPLIQEWRASTIADDLLFFLILAIVAGLTFLNRSELSVVRLLLLAGFAAMALMQSRHQPLFVITSALVLSSAFPAALSGRGMMAPLLIGLIVLSLARIAMPFERADSATYPASALRHLPAQLRSQPVFNSYSFGGPLILNGIRPYIDGRSDMYGDALTTEHHAIIMGDKRGFDRVADRYAIRWTILQPGSPLIEQLDQDPRWRRMHADVSAIVHIRR